jgi:hypothetical protein
MLFIATPTTDSIILPYHSSVVNMISYLSDNKISYKYATLSDSNQSRSRAELTQSFIQSGAEKVLFIDSDMVFTPQDVIRISSHNVPIVAGVYVKRKMKWDNIRKAMIKGDPRFACHGEYTFSCSEKNTIDENNLMPAKYVPTGFLCIKREVILKLMEAYPETRFNSQFYDVAYALNDNIIDEDGTYLSNDFSFCKRANKCGFPIYIDMALKLGHCGLFTFLSDPTVCIV